VWAKHLGQCLHTLKEHICGLKTEWGTHYTAGCSTRTTGQKLHCRHSSLTDTLQERKVAREISVVSQMFLIETSEIKWKSNENICKVISQSNQTSQKCFRRVLNNIKINRIIKVKTTAKSEISDWTPRPNYLNYVLYINFPSSTSTIRQHFLFLQKNLRQI